MNTQNSKTDKSTAQELGFNGMNRFIRMLSHLDSQDRELEPERRKRKWIVILAALAVLFLLSFLLPFPELSYQRIKPGVPSSSADRTAVPEEEQTGQAGFEMPVDSFENLLKQHIHESIPEEK